jgi:hypothetical protein
MLSTFAIATERSVSLIVRYILILKALFMSPISSALRSIFTFACYGKKIDSLQSFQLCVTNYDHDIDFP